MTFLVRTARGFDDELAPRYLRLRARYCFAAAFAVGTLALLFGSELGLLFNWITDQIWAHYPWALAPLVAFLAGSIIRAYLNIFGFFEEGSEISLIIGAVIGIVIAAIVAAAWDGQFDLGDIIQDSVPGGWFGLGICAAILMTSAASLRKIDFDTFSWYYIGAGFLAVLTFGPAIVVLGYVLAREVTWSSTVASIGDFLAVNWSVILLPIMIAGQIPYWWNQLSPTEKMEARDGSVKPRPRLSMVTIAFVTGVLFAYVVMYYLPETIISRNGLSSAQYANAITQERRTLLAALAAIGAAITLIYTHLRHQLDRDANATGRYTEAVQQLGNKSMSIRLGGIYALARVARDSPGDSKTVTQVLASFVRDGTRSLPSGISLDVMAALTELGKTSQLKTDYNYERVDLSSSKLVSGNLDSVNFPQGVDLRQSDLSSSIFRNASMRRANLTAVKMPETVFSGADLADATLDDVEAAGADFSDSQMIGVSLQRADLTNASFENASLIGADLAEAQIAGANLKNADLEGANLAKVDLRGIDLTGADLGHALLYDTGLTPAIIGNARNSEDAIFENVETDRDAARKYSRWCRRAQSRGIYVRRYGYIELYEGED